MSKKEVKIHGLVIVKDMLLVVMPAVHKDGCRRCARKDAVPFADMSCFDFPICKHYKYEGIHNVEFILVRRIGKEA